MRIFLSILAFAPLISAFAPVAFNAKKADTTTELFSSRRDVMASVAGALAGIGLVGIEQAQAFTHETYFIDGPTPTSQLVKPDKVDINSSFVGEYKQFRGMFPHAAGKIASHGPYRSVSCCSPDLLV